MILFLHRVILSLIFFSLFQTTGQSQVQINPIQWDLNAGYNRQLSQSDQIYHSMSKSFISSQFDSLSLDSNRWERRKHKGLIMRKVRNENLIVVDTHDFYLTIDPIFNFQFGRDLDDSTNRNLSNNTRGI